MVEEDLLPGSKLRLRPVAVDTLDGWVAVARDLKHHRLNISSGDIVRIDKHCQSYVFYRHIHLFFLPNCRHFLALTG